MNAILFDLDGTLLPMDQMTFINVYFKALFEMFSKNFLDGKQRVEAIMEATKQMLRNQGMKTNEEIFWDTYTSILGKEAFRDKELFDNFYDTDFNCMQKMCYPNDKVKETIKKLKQKNYTLLIASNPVFPLEVQKKRLHWAGLDAEDFIYITSYENSSSCKPNLKYYEDILKKLNLNAKDCLMVGNDVEEDMIAQNLGMNVYLITDCLLNSKKLDMSKYPHGSFEQFMQYIEEVC